MRRRREGYPSDEVVVIGANRGLRCGTGGRLRNRRNRWR
ncbi:MAG: hypothetical protein AVDCRST_MAG33-1519 [uncultured Thermomicrobiales bacterium]|uniref:Uncharacterized protein n=1 Tax=uncultured Thermomicrobiales bacterium TaxID=1645740 RepID=A0A6J4UTW4_9BACT|nr:MAG: hypothetical protein AVDCRST_MAG33-1519 [uncultured Thermomicrobiales bacterium]